MKTMNRIAANFAASLLLASQLAIGAERDETLRGSEEQGNPALAARVIEKGARLKWASAQTVASRATATSTATIYGGFELVSPALVYILVRGNSLGTLGVTQGYLDLPRLRLYDSTGRDLAFDNTGRAGFNRCTSAGSLSGPVVDYYLFVRRAPTHDDDACTSRVLSPGAYTFSVTPSIAGITTSSAQSVPTFGQILFEVTLGP